MCGNSGLMERQFVVNRPCYRSEVVVIVLDNSQPLVTILTGQSMVLRTIIYSQWIGIDKLPNLENSYGILLYRQIPTCRHGNKLYHPLNNFQLECRSKYMYVIVAHAFWEVYRDYNSLVCCVYIFSFLSRTGKYMFFPTNSFSSF